MSIKIVPITSNAIEFFNAMFKDHGANDVFVDWTQIQSLMAVAVCNTLATQLASYDEELAVKISAQLRSVAMNHQRSPNNYRVGRCTYSSVTGKTYQHQFVATLVENDKVDVYIFQIHSPIHHILKERENTQRAITNESEIPAVA